MDEKGHISVVEREIAENGKYLLKTAGKSMRPLFKDGRDIVIISKKDAPLKKYDVALYRVGEKYVLHRVVAVKDGAYIMRGDNTFFNETVSDDDIIGILSAFIRNGKRRTADSICYKLYSRIWYFIYPLRYVTRKIFSLITCGFRKIFKKRGK